MKPLTFWLKQLKSVQPSFSKRLRCGRSCSCCCCRHYGLLEKSVGDTHVLSLHALWWLKLEKKPSIKRTGLNRAATKSYSFCLFTSTGVWLSVEGWVEKRSILGRGGCEVQSYPCSFGHGFLNQMQRYRWTWRAGPFFTTHMRSRGPHCCAAGSEVASP